MNATMSIDLHQNTIHSASAFIWRLQVCFLTTSPEEEGSLDSSFTFSSQRDPVVMTSNYTYRLSSFETTLRRRESKPHACQFFDPTLAS